MTAYPGTIPQRPLGIRRILKADVRQRLRGDMKIERTFVSGHIQHSYDIQFPALTKAQRTALDGFVVTCKGRYDNTIAFPDPWDAETVTCRLDQDTVEMVEVVPNICWSSNLTLIEVSGWQALKAAVAAFPVSVPYQQLGLGLHYRTQIESTDENAEKRYEDYPSSIRQWMVGGDALTDDQADDLLDCFEGNGGPWMEFTFTDPETSTAYAHCHFVETECTHTMLQPNVNSIRLTIEQVHV